MEDIRLISQADKSNFLSFYPDLEAAQELPMTECINMSVANVWVTDSQNNCCIKQTEEL
jgi:hypothetical protein